MPAAAQAEGNCATRKGQRGGSLFLCLFSAGRTQAPVKTNPASGGIRMSIMSIRKRDGRTVDFDQAKIENAILRAFQASSSAK